RFARCFRAATNAPANFRSCAFREPQNPARTPSSAERSISAFRKAEMAPEGTHFADMKRRGEKIVVVTAYDAPTAQAAAEVGVDIILVGDSVGVNVLGYAHEREVTLSDMSHHIAAARRGAPETYIIGDLPFATYETQAQALASAKSLRDAGANCVKFEGAGAELARALKDAGFDVCGHIGLESQHHEQKRRQGKTASAALKLLE